METYNSIYTRNYQKINSAKNIVRSTNIPLSLREKKVLEFAAKGLDNPEIAKKLYISRHTVKAHFASAFRKLSALNRTHAVYIAVKNKIIE